ncbi:T9SS type A sorting domain-containing protein [Flammeovirga aprica]|uniref:T9SS type A sorting domain-containing protein n=1 Tax=Flammeovirga aprica JL-4 TaxID=694437 RepID=A0A7X9RX52_9BACT|nr:T9SS type A sorting domain-containing protein [Flammeovirga aprica]NME70309.1 T9SS type A sorting domain-containing protein [Flammeovirga aprica JL-4]
MRYFFVLFYLMLSVNIFAQNEIPADGLTLWLKADAITSDDYTDINGDGTVLRMDKWLDQSHTVTGVNTGYYVENEYSGNISDGITYQASVSEISNRPAVLFPSASHYGMLLRNSAGDDIEFLMENYEVFIVLKANDTFDDVGFYAGGNTTRALYGKWDGAQFYFRGPDNNLSNTDKEPWPIADNWGLISFQRNESNETSFTSDGGLLSPLDKNTTNTSTHKFGTVGGANYSSNLRWNGYIAEVIIYNKASGLDPVTRLRVNDYLTAKYGFTHSEKSDTDELFSGNTSPNQNVVVYGNDGGDYTPDRGNPSSVIELTTSGTSDGDYIILGETDESGLEFEFAPEKNRLWAKRFYIQKKGNLDFTLDFNIKNYEGKDNNEEDRQASDYLLVYNSNDGSDYVEVADVAASFKGTDIVSFTVSNTNYDGDGFYTIAPPAPKAFYTKGSGNWDEDIWTTNPSGEPDGNVAVITEADDFVILSGYEVTLNTNNITAADIEVSKGGRLKVGSTTGHSFKGVFGKGTIQIEGDNFPSPSTATDVGGFLTEDGGIVEFKGTGTTLTNSYSYNIVHVDLDNTADELVIDTSSPLSLSDSLLIEKGKVVLGTSDATGAGIDLTVNGNTRIKSEGALGIGTDNVVHNVVFKNSLYNSGTIALTNRAKIDNFGSNEYLTTLETYFSNNLSGQYAIVTFDADNKHQELVADGSTILYQLVVDKGTSDYYNLSISAGSTGLFEMYGYNTHSNSSTGSNAGGMTTSNGMFVLKYGTLRFGENIYIPSYANTTDNYDLGIGCKLWVDEGADINFGPVNALTVYGSVLVSGGRLNIGLNYDGTSNGNHNSITLRERGYYVQEGGQVFLNQIKTSVLGEDHQGSFTMSGGEMTIYGHVPSSNVAALSLPYKTNSFNMSGGKITIHNEDSGMDFLTDFAMGDGFYNVTGGEIIFDINTDRAVSFKSAIPFYNLTVTTDFSSRDVTLANGSYGDLNVLNHLVIEENSNLQVGTHDLIISGDLTLYNDTQLNINENNTLTFNGSSVDTDGNVQHHYIDVRDTDTPYEINNLVIDLPNVTDIFELRDISNTAADGNTRLKVINSLSLTQGTFDYTDYAIELEGDLSFQGRIGRSSSVGHLKLNGSAGTAQNITSSYDLVENQIADTTNVGITHLWINNTDGFNLSKNVYVTKLTWEEGVIKANEYGVVVGALGVHNEGGNAIGTNNKVIVGTGKSSDGGLTYLINADGTYLYPLASEFDIPVADSYKYTPASILVSNTAEIGFIQLATNNGSLVDFAADPDNNTNLLDYYWKSNAYGYTDDSNKPDITLTLNYNDEDVVGTESDYEASRILLEGDYSRSVLGTVDDATNTIELSTASKPVVGMYSAGHPDQFTGALQVYYSFMGVGADGSSVIRTATWDANQRWTTNENWKVTGPGTVSENSGEPGKGDIVVIGYGTWNGSRFVDGAGHRVKMSNIQRNVALVRFEEVSESNTYYEEDNTNGLPDIQILNNSELTVGVAEGIGRFRIYGGTDTDGTNRGVLYGNDMNDFLSEEGSELMIQNQSGNNGGTPFNDFVIPIYPKYPILRLYGGGSDQGGEFVFDDAVTETVQVKRLIVEGAFLRLDKSLDIEGTLNIGASQDGELIFDSPTSIQLSCQDIKMDNIFNNSSTAENKILTEGTDDIEHKLIVKGGIEIPSISAGDQNNIVFDLYNGETGNKVILEFQGEDNGAFINNYTAEVVPELYKIVMNKGTTSASTFTMSTNFTLPSSTTVELITLSNGTLILDNADINITPFAVPASNWELASTAGITINQGAVNITGDQANLLLGGKLTVAGGSLNLSNAGEDNSIVYAVSGEIELTGGAINIGSELRRDLAGNDGSLTYNQSGGTLSTGLQGNPNSAERGTFEVVGSESTFNFTGGEIIVASGKIDINASSSTVSESAEIKLGNNTTTETIEAVLANEIGKLELVADVTVNVEINDVQMLGDLEIPSLTTLNLNGNNLSIAGSIVNEGTFSASTSTISLVSSDAQTISGGQTITAENMIVATSGATVGMNSGITITKDLTISSGTLSDNGNTINVGGYLTINGAHTTTGAGRIKLNGTSTQSIEITGSIGRMEIDNTEGVKLVDNLALVADEIVFTNGVLDIDKYRLNLGVDIVLDAPAGFDKDRMIQLNGGVNAQGVQIELPSTDITTEKVIPIGYSGTYAPVGFFGEFDGVTVNVKPINKMHTVAEFQGVTQNALSQYWKFDFSEVGVTKDRYVSLYFKESNVNGTIGNYQGVIIDKDANIKKPVNVIDGLSDDLDNNKIKISLNSPLISGDYFAAENDATPDNIIRYKIKDGVTDARLDDVASGKWEYSTDGGGDYDDLSTDLTSGTILEVPSGVNLVTSDGDLGFKSYYRAIINGTLEVHVDDKNILFNEVEGSGTVKFYVNDSNIGQMPFADWGEFYSAGGGIVVEGDAENPLLNLNADADNKKLTIGSLTLTGTGSNQVWELPDGNGLNISSGELKIDNVEFELSTASTINDILVTNNGILKSSSASIASGDVSVESGASLNVASSSFIVRGDTEITGTLKVENSSDLYVDSNITFKGGSALEVSSGSELTVGGNFVDEGITTATLSGATLTFNGSSGDQSFTGDFKSSDGKQIGELNINKSSGNVVLSGSKEVTKLTLNSVLNNSGNTDGSLLILGESSDVTGNSWVEGPLSKKMEVGDSFLYYVGGSGSQRKLEVRYVTNNNNGGLATTEKTWTVEHSPNAQDVTIIDETTKLTVISQDYQWRVTDIAEGEDAADKQSEADIFAYYETLGKSSSYTLAVWAFGFSRDEWTRAGDPLHNTDDYFETYGVSFSKKYLAIGAVDESTDLPVELISFDAYAEESQVRLEWATASEDNNKEFELQRSIDGENWSSLKVIDGAGNSNVRLDYEFIDKAPVLNQVSYYRLVQIDFDGTTTVFDPVQVYMEGEEVADVTVYPNPVQDGKVNVLLKSWKGDVEINLYTALGYKVLSDKWSYGDSQVKQLQLHKLPRGVYVLKLKSGKTVRSTRLIVE